jgi:zeaxanthin glucosyltransferase
MSRFLFVVLSEKGHVHPFIGPAQELARRGHEVAFYAPFDLRAPLGRAGFDRVFAGVAGAPPPPDANRGRAFAELVADRARLRAWIQAMLVDTVPGEVERLTALVRARSHRPDAIVADPMAYAAPIVASREGIPWAGLSTSLNPVVPDDWTSELIETTRALPRAELFARHGAPGARFRVSDCLSPHLNVAFTTRALVGDAPPDVLLAGASMPLGARGDEGEPVALDPGRPLVFMSLGSQIYHQPRMFEVVVEASRGQPWQLVLAMGELAGVAAVPEGVQAVRYASQLALLPRARVLITHGGANSVMEALAHGVPLLVSPICNDQPHNARFVERASAGHALDLSEAGPGEVREKLAALCAEGPERAAAARIAASYAEAGGSRAAADAVLGLVR